MSVHRKIEIKLTQTFKPGFLQVENESHRHNVPPGLESHFKIIMVADAFVEKRLVARHQAVYKTLAEELAGNVHALALHLYSPVEWEAKGQMAPDSPNCLGGSKHDN